MTETVSPVERLEIERACERLIYAYARALDIGDLDAAADCFATDGVLWRPLAPDAAIQGREAIRAALATRPKGLLTKHLATNVAIEVEGRDRARGLSYLTMISTTPGGGDKLPADKPPHASQGPLWFGEFADRFVLEQGAWKFLERRGSVQMKLGRG